MSSYDCTPKDTVLLPRQRNGARTVDVTWTVLSFQPWDDHAHHRQAELGPRQVHDDHPLDADRAQAVQLPDDVRVERLPLERRHVVVAAQRTTGAERRGGAPHRVRVPEDLVVPTPFVVPR